jgi:hypothetical protein
MEEHELRESLRRLPDARPGAGFTAEVLARVERFERQRTAAAGGGAGDRARGGTGWRPALIAAGLAAALVASVGLWQPPGDGRWPGAGGEQIAAPEAPGTERLGEEMAAERLAGGGQDAASVVPRVERLAEEPRGAGQSGGERPADAAQRATIETSGRPDRLGARAGSGSRGRRDAPHRPLADRGSAATEAGGPVAEDRLASAAVVAGESEDPSGADGREDATPPATALSADTLTALPGADFFAAPPPAGVDLSALPAAERLARLRAERESLELRLAAFRSELPPAEPPVVLLGGDEGLELVFDLARWAAPPPATEAAGATRPAVHSTQGPPRRF